MTRPYIRKSQRAQPDGGNGNGATHGTAATPAAEPPPPTAREVLLAMETLRRLDPATRQHALFLLQKRK